MHGYQIMNELADRTSGVWQPSPGSIYPVLAQLTDEGLVTCEENEGRKVFSLTAEGEGASAELQEATPVWERFLEADDRVDLRQEVDRLATAARQVGTTGTAEQAARAAEIITEARKALYGLLAE